MKKLLSLLAAFILVLAGCGASGEEKTEESDGKLSGSISVGVEESYVPYFEEEAKAFMEENPGTDIKVETVGMFDLIDALPTQQGNASDVFMIPNDRIGSLADQKLITPVDADLSSYTDTAQEATKYNDKSYLLPMSTDTTLLIYNKDAYSKAPESLDAIEAKDFAAKFTDFYFAAGLFLGEGAYIFGDDASDIGLNNEGAVKAGQIISDYYASGSDTWTLMQDDTVANDVALKAFTDGTVKATINGPWTLADIEKSGVNYGIAPIPGYSKDSSYSPLVGTKGTAVNAYSDNKELAQAFITFTGSKEAQQAWYDTTKEVSPHTDVKYEEGSDAATVLEATTKGTSMPTDPNFGMVWEPMASALKQIATNEDVKKALDGAVAEIANTVEVK